MGSWADVLTRIKSAGSVHDIVRREYLSALHTLTGRNVIVYYSGFFEKPDFVAQGVRGFDVNEEDKNGFMATIHQMDRSKGLDLLLHTPGGDIAATESLVHYLRSMFGNNIRAIVPQVAMSAGTMIALSCNSIVMGKHSSIGPIDPQIGGAPAHGIVEEFRRAVDEVTANPAAIPLWQPIIAKYNPTLIGECEKAIEWGTAMVRDWLVTGMFRDKPDEAEERADRVLRELADHALTLSHARRISAEKALSIGVRVEMLEDDPEMQEAVLTLHHAIIQTLSSTPAIKIIENHLGVAFIKAVQVTAVAVPQSGPSAAEPPSGD